MDAGEVLGEEHLLALLYRDEDDAAGHLERALHRVGHPAGLGAVADDEAVHHHLYRVPLALVQVERLREVAHLAVDTDADVPGGARFFEDLLVLAFAAADHRRHDLDPAVLRQGENRVDDLLHGLHLDRPAAVVAVRPTGPGEEQAQVVVDLGDGADGGARVVGHALLVDRYGRRQALYVVDVGLVHPAEELAGVGRQRLDVAALALGVDGVEGEGALARAGDAGDHDELVAGDRDVYVLEVVLAGTPDDDVLQRHSGELQRRWRSVRSA